jgi:hypothetical protein
LLSYILVLLFVSLRFVVSLSFEKKKKKRKYWTHNGQIIA